MYEMTISCPVQNLALKNGCNHSKCSKLPASTSERQSAISTGWENGWRLPAPEPSSGALEESCQMLHPCGMPLGPVWNVTGTVGFCRTPFRNRIRLGIILGEVFWHFASRWLESYALSSKNWWYILFGNGWVTICTSHWHHCSISASLAASYIEAGFQLDGGGLASGFPHYICWNKIFLESKSSRPMAFQRDSDSTQKMVKFYCNSGRSNQLSREYLHFTVSKLVVHYFFNYQFVPCYCYLFESSPNPNNKCFGI